MNTLISRYSKLHSLNSKSTIISRCLCSLKSDNNCSSHIVSPAVAVHKSRIIGHHTTIAATRLQSRLFHSSNLSRESDTVKVTFIDPMGVEKTVDAQIGKNLLQVAHDHNIELEGACGGELACATCHLIFEKEIYDTLPEKEPEEDDMLDLAMELTETSRLGCQICVRKDMDGMKVRIPDDGY